MNTRLALYAIATLAQGGIYQDLIENCPTKGLKNSIEKK